MPKILNIETGTSVCSVALSQGETIISLRESNGEIAHASKLSVYVNEILEEQKLKVWDLDAIAVSEGPGSYTGLRIGVSTAKGLCFGANKPLIAVGSLHSLAQSAISENLPSTDTLLCPMIDARRMEVYTAVFDAKGEIRNTVSAQIVDASTYSELLKEHKMIFFGDGAPKCKSVISSPNAQFLDIKASAVGMAKIAAKKYVNSSFVDVAYFEPFYLKDFVVTASKKKFF